MRGCKYDALEELSDFAHNETVMKYAEDIMLYMSIWARDFFSDDRSDLGTYAGTVECPHSTDECTDATDCTCTLPTVIDVIEKDELDLDYAINVLIETGLYGDLAAATGWASSFDTKDDGDDISTENWEESFKDLDTAQTEALLKYVAKQGAYHSRSIMAYSLSLGSVNDPIFWAGHNAWERMWHVKRMEAEGTEDQQWWSAWNETNLLEEQSSPTCSWSSSADATLPFYDLMEDSETENKYVGHHHHPQHPCHPNSPTTDPHHHHRPHRSHRHHRPHRSHRHHRHHRHHNPPQLTATHHRHHH